MFRKGIPYFTYTGVTFPAKAAEQNSAVEILGYSNINCMYFVKL